MRERTIDRRHALRRLTLGGLGVATSPAWAAHLTALARSHAAKHARPAATVSQELVWTPKVLTPQQNETVIALSELIIPATDTPGAKAAKVNEFIDAVLAETDASERRMFMRGLKWLDQRCMEAFGARFLGCTPEQQTALLTLISSPKNKSLHDQLGVEFFAAIKSMTITGYYTSEAGMNSELADDGNRFFPDFPGCTHAEHKS